VLDWKNRADITIIITVATVTAVVSGTIVAGGAIVPVNSIVGVPAIVSIIVFIGRPSAQETSCRRVFLGRLIIVLLFRGGVVPFLGHIIVVIVFVFSSSSRRNWRSSPSVRDSSSSDQAQKSHSSAS
jgi:hypothetical protein